jgi:hypothetical protein
MESTKAARTRTNSLYGLARPGRLGRRGARRISMQHGKERDRVLVVQPLTQSVRKGLPRIGTVRCSKIAQ